MNATRKHKRRRGYRPLLELLEDRLVPAAYTVNSVGDANSGSGTTGDLRFCINQADANPGSSIGFDATVFATAQTITLNGTALPDVSQSVPINGPAAGVTVSAAGKSRVFIIDAGAAVTMSNLTITGGIATGNVDGGGIDNQGTLTLTGCTLVGNTAAGPSLIQGGSGGGIANFASLTLTNCTLSGNSANILGGGLFNQGTATLTNCSLSGNAGPAIGSGLANQGTAELADCTVSGNTGTGINNSGDLTMTGCTVSGNSAGSPGAGMENIGSGTATLLNCTVSGNTTSGTGGGFVNENGAKLILTNCTVSGNTANAGGPGSPGGGGIANFGEGGVTLNNTIVAGNHALADPDVLNVTGPGFVGTVTAAFSLIGDGTGSGLTNGVNGNQVGTGANPINPLLAPLGNYGGPTQTMALLPGSPARGAGNVALAVGQTSTPLATDQRGLPRVVHGAVDIGAVEFQGVLVVNSTADTNTRDNVLTLREALLFANGGLTLGELTPAEQKQVGSDPGEPGDFVITFDPTVFATAQTITLGGTALPDVTQNVRIDGPAAGVTVNAAGQSRDFVIDAGATATITNLAIRGGTTTNDNNPATDSGGGIYNSGTLTLSNCTLGGNSASHDGGGLDNNGGAVTLTNCTLSGNSAGGSGGGFINLGSGTVSLTNCTLSGNTASSGGGNGGGGIANFATVTLNNTIVAGDAAVTGPDVFNSDTVTAAFSLIGNGSGSGLTNGVNGNQVGTAANPINPLLAPLGNYGGPTQTMALLPGSPAIDRGSNALATGLAADQRGQPRIVNGTVDVGAVEAQGFILTVFAGADQAATLGTPFPTNLAVRVTANDPAEPVQGGVVTFTAPVGGASGTFANGQTTATATIDASGTATAPTFTANGTAGLYAVAAAAAGAATPVTFPLDNTPSTTPPTPPVVAGNQRFVANLYEVLLGRPGSPSEVNFLASVLDEGFLTQAQLAVFFLNSFEFHEHEVNQLYLSLLRRPADPATLTLGAVYLSNGGSLDQLEAVILGSDEYFQLHGSTNAGFLQGLEQDVLGGSIDPTVLSLFEAELATGTPRYAIAQQALALPQAAVAEAERLYQQVLGRTASPAELAFPAAFLFFGGSETDVLLALLLSDEFAMLL